MKEEENTMARIAKPDKQIKRCQNCKNAELYLEGLYLHFIRQSRLHEQKLQELGEP